MQEEADSGDANTPLDEEESEQLIPGHLTTRAELNQWEALNIANAYSWLAERRSSDVLTVDFLRSLHRKMFDETWTWAGRFRTTDKNLSPFPWHNVPVLMRELVENTRARFDASDRSERACDELAARFHHELVRIHPWANGNGRHSRLATDLLLVQWGRPVFSWGSGADLIKAGAARTAYIQVLRRADDGDIEPLRQFCRS